MKINNATLALIKITLILTALALMGTSLSCKKKDNTYVIMNPESVVWNPVTNTYLISNAGGGKILGLKDKKEFFLFNKTPLNSPKGMTIMGQTLYVTDINQVVGYKLADGKEVFRVKIPAAKFLNDIAAAPDSILYISDMKGNAILSLDIRSKKTKAFTAKQLREPNGLYYLQQGKDKLLYIVSFHANALTTVFNTATGSFTTFPGTEVSMADGITQDAEGNWLVSGWQNKAIYKFKPDWSMMTRLPDKVDSPADIYFNTLANELCIPQFNTNQISFTSPVAENNQAEGSSEDSTKATP